MKSTLSKTARASLRTEAITKTPETVLVIEHYRKPSGSVGQRRHIEQREVA